ncbi:hypothetical protein ACWIG5_23890 [Streptomyces lydicus]
MPDDHLHQGSAGPDHAEPEAAVGSAVSALSQLSDELHSAWHPAHAAHLLALTAQDEGLIAQLDKLITDVGHWALGLPDKEGLLVYQELLRAAARLESVRVQIAAQTGALVRYQHPPACLDNSSSSTPHPGYPGPDFPQAPARLPRKSTGHRR